MRSPTRFSAARPGRARGPVRAVRVEARAKLNLGLAVGPRRPDGFHELATLFQTVSLADTLIARRLPHGFDLRVRFESAALRGGSPATARPGVPSGSRNLVLRAARRFAALAGLSSGAGFELVKRIPAGTGLGGGSADAAATLAALGALYRVRLSPSERLALAAELGADVPFACRGGTALGLGRGDRLTPLRLARPFRALLAVPKWRILTQLAFDQIDRNKYGLTGWSAKLRFAQRLVTKSVSAENALLLGNDFESALGRRKVEFASLCSRLERAGVPRVRMTGSGSAVFGIIPPRTSVAAVLSKFTGKEALYEVHSTQRGLKLITI